MPLTCAGQVDFSQQEYSLLSQNGFITTSLCPRASISGSCRCLDLPIAASRAAKPASNSHLVSSPNKRFVLPRAKIKDYPLVLYTTCNIPHPCFHSEIRGLSTLHISPISTDNGSVVAYFEEDMDMFPISLLFWGPPTPISDKYFSL